ncbi:MAG: hypothetical protein ACYC7E_11360 [Armatimonadota bacterium]
MATKMKKQKGGMQYLDLLGTELAGADVNFIVTSGIQDEATAVKIAQELNEVTQGCQIVQKEEPVAV